MVRPGVRCILVLFCGGQCLCSAVLLGTDVPRRLALLQPFTDSSLACKGMVCRCWVHQHEKSLRQNACKFVSIFVIYIYDTYDIHIYCISIVHVYGILIWTFFQSKLQVLMKKCGL